MSIFFVLKNREKTVFKLAVAKKECLGGSMLGKTVF